MDRPHSARPMGTQADSPYSARTTPRIRVLGTRSTVDRRRKRGLHRRTRCWRPGATTDTPYRPLGHSQGCPCLCYRGWPRCMSSPRLRETITTALPTHHAMRDGRFGPRQRRAFGRSHRRAKPSGSPRDERRRCQDVEALQMSAAICTSRPRRRRTGLSAQCARWKGQVSPTHLFLLSSSARCRKPSLVRGSGGYRETGTIVGKSNNGAVVHHNLDARNPELAALAKRSRVSTNC